MPERLLTHGMGMTEECTSVEYGRVAALHEIAKRAGLVDIINSLAPKRNGIPVGELVELLAINRILDPQAKLTIPEWYQGTYLPELLGVDLPVKSGYQTLTRCYDYLTDQVQTDIEFALSKAVRENFSLTDNTYFYDITSTFVEGEGKADILQYGYSRDGRPDRRQVNYGLVVSSDYNIPLFHQTFPGNMNDSKTIKSTMQRFHEELGLNGCMVVDRGMVSTANIIDIVDERKLDLVAGLQLNKGRKKIIRSIPLAEYDHHFEYNKESFLAIELSLSIGKKDRRCILYYSEGKAKRDEMARKKKMRVAEKLMEEFRQKAERTGQGRKVTSEALAKQIDKELENLKISNLIEFRFVGGRGGRRFKWQWNEKGLKEAQMMDGKYMLITTLDKEPEEILKIYRSRDGVERAFRITKQNIKIRPMFNHKKEHIKAHLFICFVAYLLVSLLQMTLRKSGMQITAIKALNSLIHKRVEVKRVVDSQNGNEVLRRLGIAPNC